jgi:glycerol-3-phosphate acyltransferase PlsY
MVFVLSLLAYLAGSVPSGLIIGRWFTGQDVRRYGSGNIGAANVSRLAGFRAALLVLFLDTTKGVLPVLLGRWFGLSPTELAIVSGVAVLGHDYSAFLRFSGGKGVATTLGVMLVLAPVATLIAAAVWALVAALTRYSSLASLSALFVLPLTLWLLNQPVAYSLLALALAVLGLYKHRDNIMRLATGHEARIGRQRTVDE